MNDEQQFKETSNGFEAEKNVDDEDIYNITNKVSSLSASGNEPNTDTAETKEDGEEDNDKSSDPKNGDAEGDEDEDDDDDDRINVVIDLKKPFNGGLSPTRQAAKTNQVIINSSFGF